MGRARSTAHLATRETQSCRKARRLCCSEDSAFSEDFAEEIPEATQGEALRTLRAHKSERRYGRRSGYWSGKSRERVNWRRALLRTSAHDCLNAPFVIGKTRSVILKRRFIRNEFRSVIRNDCAPILRTIVRHSIPVM
jgi:hypothetical protein